MLEPENPAPSEFKCPSVTPERGESSAIETSLNADGYCLLCCHPFDRCGYCDDNWLANAIHEALAHGDDTPLGDVREALAIAVNAYERSRLNSGEEVTSGEIAGSVARASMIGSGNQAAQEHAVEDSERSAKEIPQPAAPDAAAHDEKLRPAKERLVRVAEAAIQQLRDLGNPYDNDDDVMAVASETLSILNERITAKFTPALNTGTAMDALCITAEALRELKAEFSPSTPEAQK